MKLSDLPQSELSTSYFVPDSSKLFSWENHLYMRPYVSSDDNEKIYFRENPSGNFFVVMCHVFHGQIRIGDGFRITFSENFNEKKIESRVLQMIRQYIPNCPDLKIVFFRDID